MLSMSSISLFTIFTLIIYSAHTHYLLPIRNCFSLCVIIVVVVYFCTEANSTAPESEENEWKGRDGGDGGGGGVRSGTVKTPTSGTMQTANTGKVKFDPPSVPVIFVLGNTNFLIYYSFRRALLEAYLDTHTHTQVLSLTNDLLFLLFDGIFSLVCFRWSG